MRSLRILACATLVACGSPQAASTPTPTSSSSASTSTSTSTPTPTASSTPTPTASSPPPEPTHAQKKPLEIKSECKDVVSVVLGDDAKSGTKKSLMQSSSIEGFRRADGSQTVWLLDEQGEPIATVHVTRHMKSVEVGRSCRTMDAH